MDDATTRDIGADHCAELVRRNITQAPN